MTMSSSSRWTRAHITRSKSAGGSGTAAASTARSVIRISCQSGWHTAHASTWAVSAFSSVGSMSP